MERTLCPREAASGGAGGVAREAAPADPVGSATRLDYLVVTDADLGPVRPGAPARMLVAARVGTTRLIDNAPLFFSGEG